MTNDDIRSQIAWLRGELARREAIAEEGLPHVDDLKYSFLTEPPRWEENLCPEQAPFSAGLLGFSPLPAGDSHFIYLSL